MFTKTLETQSALGPALQAAFKLMSPTGGRMSVFQTQLPTLGVGALRPREEPNQRSSAKVRKSSNVCYHIFWDSTLSFNHKACSFIFQLWRGGSIRKETKHFSFMSKFLFCYTYHLIHFYLIFGSLAGRQQCSLPLIRKSGSLKNIPFRNKVECG